MLKAVWIATILACIVSVRETLISECIAAFISVAFSVAIVLGRQMMYNTMLGYFGRPISAPRAKVGAWSEDTYTCLAEQKAGEDLDLQWYDFVASSSDSVG
jgi:hypothetical protein